MWFHGPGGPSVCIMRTAIAVMEKKVSPNFRPMDTDSAQSGEPGRGRVMMMMMGKRLPNVPKCCPCFAS